MDFNVLGAELRALTSAYQIHQPTVSTPLAKNPMDVRVTAAAPLEVHLIVTVFVLPCYRCSGSFLLILFTFKTISHRHVCKKFSLELVNHQEM